MNDGPAKLCIEGELSLYQAADIKRAVLDALAAHRDLQIDLSQVTEFDTAGVQLLLMAKRAAHANGGALYLVGHSPDVLDVFELLDLAGNFGDALVAVSRERH